MFIELSREIIHVKTILSFIILHQANSFAKKGAGDIQRYLASTIIPTGKIEYVGAISIANKNANGAGKNVKFFTFFFSSSFSFLQASSLFLLFSVCWDVYRSWDGSRPYGFLYLFLAAGH